MQKIDSAVKSLEGVNRKCKCLAPVSKLLIMKIAIEKIENTISALGYEVKNTK